MVAQLSLDFNAPRARTSDPVSSRMAAAALESAGVLSAQRREVLEALKQHGPATSAELADRAGLCRFRCARRWPGACRVGTLWPGSS